MKLLRFAGALLLVFALATPAFANDLSNSTWNEVDGSNNSASPTGWASGSMLPSQVEPTARAMMGALKRWYNHANGTATSGGAANVQTLTYSVAPASYATGDFYLFKAGFTNTSATTLNVNALGAKTVQRAGLALRANDILSGYYYGVVYDGTQFQLLFSSALYQSGVAAAQFNPSSPAGTTSATLVNMGLGSTCVITPRTSGNVLFIFTYVYANSGVAAGAVAANYGTGTAPANGTAESGTRIVPASQLLPGNASGVGTGTTQGFVTGLPVNTAHWSDLSLSAVAGTESLTSVICNAVELR